MASYGEGRIKLTNTQLDKLKPAAKIMTGTTLRITKKNYQHEEMAHESTNNKTKKLKQELPLLTICQQI